MQFMVWVWLGAIVVFGALEIATASLVSIWFVAGAAAALITVQLGGRLLTQLTIFVLVSAVTLALTRPLVRRLTTDSPVATNADRTLGETARVTETVDNRGSTGAVYVDGKTWTARSADDTVIPVGSLVRVERMEGVKLFVKICEEKVEVML